MDASAPWESDPVVGATPASASPWENDPVVGATQAPAAAAVPSQDAPNLAPPAPGVTLTQNGQTATPAPAASAPPAQPLSGTRQEVLDAQALDKGAVADTLGMPVDLTAGAMNAGSALANVIGHILGNPNDVTPYIHDPIGGSQSISDLAGGAYHALTGRDVASPATMTPQEQSRYRTIETGANAATTEGFGSLFGKLARLASAPEVAPATTAQRVYAPAVEGPTPGSVATAAAAGAGAGAAQDAYEQHAAPIVRAIPVAGPELDALLDAASGYAGGAGGGLLASGAKMAGRAASVPARAVARAAFPGDNAGNFTLQSGRVATPKDLDAAAALAQRAAIDPAKAAQNIADTTNTLRAHGPVVPTTGAMSADPGLVGLEQQLRLDSELKPAFIQNDKGVQQAAVNAVAGAAPPNATGRAFTDAANAAQAAKVAGAQGAVDTTQQAIDQLEAERLNAAAPVAAARNTQVPASQALDKNVVHQTLLPMQEKNAAMYAAADPNKTATVSADPLLDAASNVVSTLGQFNSPDKVIPGPLLRRIQATQPDNSLPPELEAEIAQMSPAAQEQIRGQLVGPQEPAQTTIGDIVQVYPELAQTEQRARRAGNYALADNIRTLRNAMDGVVEQSANSGDPAGLAAMAARENWLQTLGTVFSDGPGGPATQFRKNFNVDRFGRSTTPPENTAGQFLQAGQPQKAQSLQTIISNSQDPAAGQRAAGQYLLADLAGSGAVDAQGHLNPQAIANWRAKWGESTLATAPGFVKQLDGLQASAASGSDSANQLANQLRAKQAALATVQQNDTAFRRVVGYAPTQAVANIFASPDPERAMQEIVGQIGQGSAASDGLKAAVREYLTNRATTSALQKTTTGDNPISFAKLDQLFKENEGALSQVFSPGEMAKLQAAHTFLGSLKNLEQQSLAGSATAERQKPMSDKLWNVLEIGLKARYGGLEGGNKLRNIRLAATLQGGGPNAVAHLLGEMQFNPELAGALLTRPVKRGPAGGFDSKLFDTLVIPSAVARQNLQEPAQ